MSTADGKRRGLLFVELRDGERGVLLCVADWTPLEVRREGNCEVRFCPKCKVDMLWHWDMGKLDLNSLPEIEDNDFEIFA